MKIGSRLLLAIVVVAGVGIAAAQNIGFLQNAPVAYLSDEEKDLLREAFGRALNEAAVGETVDWSNADTGHGGSLEVLDTHEDYSTICRTLRIHTRAGGREGGAVQRLCKAEDGSWRFAPARRSDS